MKIKTLFHIFISAIVLVVSVQTVSHAGPVSLGKPQFINNKQIMECLNKRSSTRSFRHDPLPQPVLSGLLWAAFGVNRPQSGKRTAPSACNWQEIDIYVAMKEGLFVYAAQSHSLEKVLDTDIRALTGKQSFTKDAPVVLIYVAGYDTMRGDAETKAFYAATDTGFISQNVYLYCASEGLATVVLGWVNKEKLHQAMKLTKEQHIMLTQPVGYPKK